MAEIVNLRMARKARKRSGATALAAANRAKFGQEKAAKLVRRRESERAEALLDGAQRERDS